MWSMPRSILKVVAGLIAACGLVGLVLGFQGAPERGHLPGESPKGDSAEALTATDVKPLVEDAPPPAAEQKKPEEVKKTEEDAAEAADVPVPAPEAPPAKPATKPAGPDDKVGDLLDGVTPPPQEEPPH